MQIECFRTGMDERSTVTETTWKTTLIEQPPKTEIR